MESNLVNIGIIVTYILFSVAVLAAIGMPLVYFIKNFNIDKAKGAFIRIGVLIVILIFSFLVSSGETGPVHEQFGVGSLGSRFIGAAIITTYILIIGSVLVSIYSEIANKLR